MDRLKFAMPTVFRLGPYRFFFYSGDRDEPAHVHVQHDDKIARFWLDPVRLDDHAGLTRIEVARIRKLIPAHREWLLGAWHDFFDT